MIELNDASTSKPGVEPPKVTQEHVNSVLEKNCVVLANKINEILKIQQEQKARMDAISDQVIVLESSFKTLIYSLNGAAPAAIPPGAPA